MPICLHLNYRDRLIPAGEMPVIDCEIGHDCKTGCAGILRAVLKNGHGQEIASLFRAVQDGSGQASHEILSFTPTDPGFYSVQVDFSADAPSRTEQARISFGYAPEKIAPKRPCPGDFLEFWNESRKQLEQIPPCWKVIDMDDPSRPDVKTSLVEFTGWGHIRVRGWYVRPAGSGRYPALIQFPGHGASLVPNYNWPELAVFSLNIRGHGNSQDQINPGFPGFLTHGIGSRENYIYRGVYLDCLRSIQFLRTRPEIEPSRIVTEGHSQGGALALISAALDQQIAFCLPDVPFLADFDFYLQQGEWPRSEFDAFLSNHPSDREGLLSVLAYFDVVNFTPLIGCPVLMATGLNDIVCPPAIAFAAHNWIIAPKELIIYPDGDHNTTVLQHARPKREWLLNRITR